MNARTSRKRWDPTLDLGLPGDGDPDPIRPDLETPTPIDLVVKLTMRDRKQRLANLIDLAHRRFDEGMAEHTAGRRVGGVCLLTSGGNDSYTVAHLFKDRATHMVHANTGTGIEATRKHVRDTAELWGLPLLEHKPPMGQRYRDLVLGNVYAKSKKTGLLEKSWPGGFPGPAAHHIMYQRLKGRALAKVPHDLGVSGDRAGCVVLVGGRRRAESTVRSNVPHHERNRTTVWLSPIAVWHKADLRTYRLVTADSKDPVPVNPVAQRLGMSGECGCLSNAKAGERQRWFNAYPNDPFILEVQELEAELADRDDIPYYRKLWGWGGEYDDPGGVGKEGPICGKSCGPDPLLDLMDPLFDLEELNPWVAA